MYRYWSVLSVVFSLAVLIIEAILLGYNTFQVQVGAVILIAFVQILLLLVKQNFSIALIHWFFVILFFGIVPGVKFYFNVFPLVAINSNPEQLLRLTNYVIIAWSSVYAISYAFSKTVRYGIIQYKHNKVRKKQYLPILALGLLALAIFVFFKRPFALFIRGGGISGVFSSNIIKLVFQYFCRPAAFFLFVVLILETPVKSFWKKNLSLFFMAIFLFFAYNSPVATARFYAFAIWVSVIALFFFKNTKSGLKLLGILGGGIFGAELVSGFRGGIQSALNSEISFGLNYWTSMTFDAYEMLASAVSYTIANGYLYGSNLLGAMWFFVPRSIWENKPIGSGAFLMEEFYKFNNPYGDFSNVSCPLVAESYLSFGFIGVIGAALMAGGVARLMDDLYKNTLGKIEVGLTSFRAYYFVAGGTFFFMMRGDLMSSWAYLSGITTSFIVVTWLASGSLSFSKHKLVE